MPECCSLSSGQPKGNFSLSAESRKRNFLTFTFCRNTERTERGSFYRPKIPCMQNNTSFWGNQAAERGYFGRKRFFLQKDSKGNAENFGRKATERPFRLTTILHIEVPDLRWTSCRVICTLWPARNCRSSTWCCTRGRRTRSRRTWTAEGAECLREEDWRFKGRKLKNLADAF